jgi:predicted transcriptional regulator
MSSSAAALKLFDLIQSHRVTAVIYVAAEIGIAELLRDGARSLDELAEATGADRHALGRLLTALSTVGLCSRVDADRYSLTEIGAHWIALRRNLSRHGQFSKATCFSSPGMACWRPS